MKKIAALMFGLVVLASFLTVSFAQDSKISADDSNKLQGSFKTDKKSDKSEKKEKKLNKGKKNIKGKKNKSQKQKKSAKSEDKKEEVKAPDAGKEVVK